jgi:hypothetical protein
MFEVDLSLAQSGGPVSGSVDGGTRNTSATPDGIHQLTYTVGPSTNATSST